MKYLMPKRFARVATASLLPALLILLALLPGCGGDKAVDQDEVWILGLDGADWDILDPMIEAGELPNLAALRDGGVWGRLRSVEPMLSPILWTSIATGKSADKHGVTWFMTDGPDGKKVPVGSHERRVRALWTIADEAGLSSGIIGWWASWPAERVKGWIYTDYVGSHSFGVSGLEDEGGKTWPDELVGEAVEVMEEADEESRTIVHRMVNMPDGELDAQIGSSYESDLAHLQQSIATTRGYTDLVLKRLEDDRPALMGVYYEGTDAMQHLFTDHMPPRQPWISVEDYERHHDTVHQYWIWQDELLGELLDKRGPRTTIVIVSDHGFRTGAERRKEDRFSIETADADHMIDGVIVINGPGVVAGGKLASASLFDVTPTVLYMMGLPVAEDMVGRVLEDAFLPETFTQRPMTSVPTYETHAFARPPFPGHDEAAGEDLEQMLESLGYVAGRSDGSGGYAETSAEDTPVEHVVNMATILMKQGRADEAARQLQEALDRVPGHSEVRLNLAQALARSGQAEESEALYRGLLEEFPQRLDVHEDYGLFLGLAGRTEEALAVYDDGLTRDPTWVNGLASRGSALNQLGRTDEAEQSVRAALAADPSHSGAQYYLGQIQVQRNDLDGAAASLRRVLELEPGQTSAALLLADVQERRGRASEALELLQGLSERGHGGPDVDSKLGTLLMSLGRPDEALGVLERARAERPADPELLGNLGIAYAMNQRLPEAAGVFEEVTRLQPESAEAFAQLGIFQAQLNQPQKAEASLVRAVAIDGANPMTQLHLGMLRHGAGRLDEARASYARAVELAPDLASAWYNLGMIEGASGNQEKATEYITKARQLDPSLPPPGQGR